jgi:hypothetical protein
MYVCSLENKGAEKTSKKLFRTETGMKGTKGPFFLFFSFWQFCEIGELAIDHPSTRGAEFSFKDFVMM